MHLPSNLSPFYMLALFKTIWHPAEKAAQNPTMIIKDAQGKGWPRTAALRQRLEWVRGKA
jgi:hypothetical protein